MRVEIRPGVNILGVLRHLEYKPWYALAEYVDNSVQSYMTERHRLPRSAPLRVSIEIDRQDDLIVVRDNAGGISEQEIPRAFRPADPPSNADGLGQFGMGMKSASCWFSPFWEVRTSPIGEPAEHRIRFDINRIIEHRVEKLDIQTAPADVNAHYTEITLRSVYQVPQGRTLAKIRQHLADIYRCFLREGTVEIEVSGVHLVPDDPDCLNAPLYSADNEPQGAPIEWKKDLAFELSDGRVVCGVAGLLAKGDTKQAGLSLFRRNRAIVGTGDEKFRPAEVFGSGNTYESQRVWGELHMDDFDVSHTKDGFQWAGAEEEFLGLLKEALDEKPLCLLRQARNYRAGRQRKGSPSRAAAEAVDGVADVLTKHGGKDLERGESKSEPEPAPPSKLPKVAAPAVEMRTFWIVAAGAEWKVTIELDGAETATQWLEIACDQNEAMKRRELSLRIFLASPFMRRVVRVDELESLEPVLRIAAAIGFAEILGRMSKSGP